MEKKDALELIESNSEMVYRILSFLENNTSMDGFIYTNHEQDLYFTVFFALGKVNYIEFILSPECGSEPYYTHFCYEKKLMPEGKEYLLKLRQKIPGEPQNL